MKKTLKVFLLPFFVLLAVIIACNKADTVTVADAVDQTLYSVQERGGMGKYGCYELVFPVTITLPDSTTATVNSYDELKAALKAYFETNGVPSNGNGNGHGHHHGPHNGITPPQINFVFPISVLSQDGEVITVANESELLALREACAGTFGNHDPQGHGEHGLSCFELVFPVTIMFPDSTTAQAADRVALKDLIHTWRQNNPTVHERPQLVFPVTVIMTDDSTSVTVNSSEELHALKESCE